MSGLGSSPLIEGLSREVFVSSQTGEKNLKIGEVIFPPRRVWVKTFGCQMNYHDTERILVELKEYNFTLTEQLEEANLILFNTCAVRDLANSKFYSQLGALKKKKKEGLEVKIGVGGCVAQTEGKQLLKKYQHLDFSFGTDSIDSLPDILFRLYSGERKINIGRWDRSSDFSIETKITQGSPTAFVNIIKGCDKYCSYCIVPYTRGRERSRLIEEIVRDVRRLVEYQGIQEVTLLGQNVNSFGKENKQTLAQLLGELEFIEGLQRVRYTTSHPYDVSPDLIKAHASLKKLSRHLHLPVQSGSNSVLSRMQREYTVEHYLDLLQQLREALPTIVITSDIIVGFPQETQEEYEATLKLLEKAKFDLVYSYVFSSRGNTKAAKMEDFVSAKEKSRRLRELQAFQLSIQAQLRQEMQGRVYRVLIDGQSSVGGITKWKGRTDCNRLIHLNEAIETQDMLWHWADVEVTRATALSSQGILKKNYGKVLPQELPFAW